MSDEIKNPEVPEETAEQLENQTAAVETEAAADEADDSRKDRPKREFAPKGEGAPRVPRFKKKVCRFCHDKALPIDYKRSDILEGFITERGKILPRRITGTCARHQRDVAREIKRARIIALLPFVEK